MTGELAAERGGREAQRIHGDLRPCLRVEGMRRAARG